MIDKWMMKSMMSCWCWDIVKQWSNIGDCNHNNAAVVAVAAVADDNDNVEDDAKQNNVG